MSYSMGFSRIYAIRQLDVTSLFILDTVAGIAASGVEKRTVEWNCKHISSSD